LSELNFIDIANPSEKDFRFFVYKESLLNRFQIDFSKDLTDLTENIKMQGFATGLLIAVKKPEIVDVGPRKMMYLTQDLALILKLLAQTSQGKCKLFKTS